MAIVQLQSRRSILTIVLILVVLAMAIYLVIRFTGGSTPATTAQPNTTQPKVVAVTTKSHAGKKSKHSSRAVVTADVRAYAAQIAPILGRSAAAFTRSASATRNAGGSGLSGACTNAQGQAEVWLNSFEGVPHPQPWYSRVGSLHHWLAGIYHYMIGSADQCQNAVSNDDSTGATSARGDISNAAQYMRAAAAYMRTLD